MKKVLVTGADGQLGKTLQEMASDYPFLDFDFKTHNGLDITDEEDVRKTLEDSAYDYCINCAAYTNVEKAEKEPQRAYMVNAEGVKNLALACSQNDAVLLHISTDYVFDGEKDSPYKPDDKPNPINEYGKSKLKGEQLVQDLLMNYYIIRTSWLYSKKFGNNFYKTILKKAKEGGTLKVTDAQKGCPTESSSLARFVIESLILKNAPFGIYHFTDGKIMTWFDFAKSILEDHGLEKDTQLVVDRNYRTFAERPKNSTLSHFDTFN